MIARLLTLRVDLRDETAAAEVTPEALAAYCERTGWRLACTTTVFRVYHRDDAPDAEVQAPLEAGWRDYGRRICQEIGILASVEGRSPLAVWADLVGLADPAAAALAHLDEMLAGMVARPRMYARNAEALLTQALLALETRALLRGEPDPTAAYDAARRRLRVPASLHASDVLDLAGVAALVGELAGGPPATPDCRREDGPRTRPPAERLPSAPPDAGQGVLPGLEAPGPGRPSAVHRWGIIAAEEMPPLPLDAGERKALVQSCPHCGWMRRRANTGARLGAEDTYSRDGRDWQKARPPCRVKR